MKKILIIGGSHRDIPLITAYKKLGYYTITVGNLEYYIGHNYADKSFKIDFRNEELLKNIIKKESIDYVVPGSGEFPMIMAGKLSHNPFLDSLKVIETLHYKDRFKNLCNKVGAHTPCWKITDGQTNYQDMLFPVIVKPINLSGGKGISIANNYAELNSSIKNAQILSGNDNVLIEEFIDSNLYAYSVIFKNQKIIYNFLAQEIESNYYVTTTFRASIEKQILKRLNLELENIAKELLLKDGLLHVQFMIKDNIAYILEVTRRIPGDLFPYLIDFSDGVNYSEAVALSYLGKTKNIKSLLKKTSNNNLIRYCIQTKQDCIFDDIHIAENINIYTKIIIFSKGSFVKANTLVSIAIIDYSRDILGNIDKQIYAKEKPK